MSKLHPIYVALDSHQYNRAIKLAAALPDSNTLGKALLAHAYCKSGQRYSSIVTLQKNLGNFCELRYEVEHSIEAVSAEQNSPKQQPQQEHTTTSKKGKKGKKKPESTTKNQRNSSAEKAVPQIDIIEELNRQPSLSENWDVLPPSENAITDETTLATMSVTLQSLKLPLTAYQMYAWAASADGNEEILTKTFCLGLNVLASPSKWDVDSQTKICTHVLAHMQALALQWARLLVSQPSVSTFSQMLATGWASQCSLWQLQWLPTDENRSLILPRLAESMARRLIDQEGERSPSAEIRLLCLRILEYQSKWSEMVDLFEKSSVVPEESEAQGTVMSEFGVSLTSHQIQTEKARVLCKLEEYDRARLVYEDLLDKSPDDWSCWKGHLECCAKINRIHLTESFVKTVMEKQSDSKYPLRGLHLMKVELAAHSFRSEPKDTSLQSLASAIERFGTLFSSRASCAFSDLEVYVELLVTKETQSCKNILRSLLDFAENLRTTNSYLKKSNEIENSKERLSCLRAFIFATKLNHKLLSFLEDLHDRYLIDCAELVVEWEMTLSLSPSSEEVTQKELKPGDDLALLAVHQLLYTYPEDDGAMIACAALLEKAIQHSPDNAYLKIAAMDVFYQLDATSRSWALFQRVGLKHIQLDSCTYTIMSYLSRGGLYNETIEICNSMLRFQATTARDCGDYAGRAMNSGTLSKADEFMRFQRTKMNKSLSAVEARGLILDAAPLLGAPVPRKRHDEDPIVKGCLGLHQGIVGTEKDAKRAVKMVSEVHNPYAALSLVSWAENGGSVQDLDAMADNRDTSILFHQILYKSKLISKESIIVNSLRRGYMHGLLIRAALCLEVAKGPKKGKMVKSGEVLEKRTRSLLNAVDSMSAFSDTHSWEDDLCNGECYKALLKSVLDLCRVLAMISSGLGQSDVESDSLEMRETRATEILHTAALSQLKNAREKLQVPSVKIVCSLLPNYVVPLFSLFRMCSSICVTFGWGKRKRKTKKCAAALADFAHEFNLLILDFLSCIERLPPTESSSATKVKIAENFLSMLKDEDLIEKTKDEIMQAQYRTRVRVEPILQDMNEFLESFDVTDN